MGWGDSLVGGYFLVTVHAHSDWDLEAHGWERRLLVRALATQSSPTLSTVVLHGGGEEGDKVTEGTISTTQLLGLQLLGF